MFFSLDLCDDGIEIAMGEDGLGVAEDSGDGYFFVGAYFKSEEVVEWGAVGGGGVEVDSMGWVLVFVFGQAPGVERGVDIVIAAYEECSAG